VAQVPPIGSQQQFALGQTTLAHNPQLARRHTPAHADWLRCLVSGGLCRTSGRARTQAPAEGDDVCRGTRPAIPSCRDRNCPARVIPARRLDALVWHDLCEVLTHPEAIAPALQRAQGGQWLPQELQARRAPLRKTKVALAQQLERLTDAYLERVIPLAESGRRRHDLEHRLQTLARQGQQWEASVDRHMDLTRLATAMADFCQRVQQGLAPPPFAQQRPLVERLIACVVVPNAEVEIRDVIPTSSRSEHVRFCHVRKDYFTLGAVLEQTAYFGGRHCQPIGGVILGAVSDDQAFQSACQAAGL
jgi:site-specific DNA recombinase